MLLKLDLEGELFVKKSGHGKNSERGNCFKNINIV
jgi:hypothetical protein